MLRVIVCTAGLLATALTSQCQGQPAVSGQLAQSAQPTQLAQSAQPVVPPGTVSSGIITTSPSPHTVTVTASRQPDLAFKVALGSRMSGIVGYSTTVCNSDPVNQATVSGGFVSQLLQRSGIQVIPISVASMIATSARVHSKLYKTVDITAQLAYYASLLIGANFIKFSNADSFGAKATHLAPIIISHETERARDNLAQQLPDPLVNFRGKVLEDNDIILGAGGCQTLLLLADGQGKVMTVSGEVAAR